MLFSKFVTKSPARKPATHDELRAESLEDRRMLSTVEVFAAGTTGEENLDIFLNGNYQTTFQNVGGDVESRSFQRLVFETERTLTPADIGIAFGNDFFDSASGIDRNLLVDRIVVDGVTVETEDPRTLSTGIWDNGLTGPGFYETELFNVNAIFTYADPVDGPGDQIEFTAFGTTGDEIVNLVVSDEVVATFGFQRAGAAEVFSFVAEQDDLSIEDIRIEFINDFYDPVEGIDRNVKVNGFQLTDTQSGLVRFASTLDADVLSSGIFVEGVGITEGFGADGFLATNGFVQVVR